MNCRNWLVVDFDGTCSIDDTTPMLPRLAALCAKELLLADNEQQAPSSQGSMSSEERQSKFSELEQEYFALYMKAKSECQPPTTAPTTTDTYNSSNNNKERVISSLTQALERLDQVSNIVTAKVSASGCLSELQADLQHTDFVARIVEKYGDEMKVGIRPHCGSILRQVIEQQQHREGEEQRETSTWGLAVLSINWCPSLIAASLQRELFSVDPNMGKMPIIWSNRVDSETGTVVLSIPGAVAKREKIASLRKKDSSRGIIVYIGDSSTDLLAILEADVGILFGGSSSTIVLAQQHGVAVRPLAERSGMEEEEKEDTKTNASPLKSEPIIWTADCWSEIAALMKEDDSSTWFR